nr:unnamed protein product [Digitaria exilis]
MHLPGGAEADHGHMLVAAAAAGRKP